MINRIIRSLLAIFGVFAAVSGNSAQPVDPIIYDEVVPLDAERLAEQGIIEVYDEIEPVISGLGGHSDELRAITNEKSGSYAIEHRGIVYPVSGGDIDVSQGWGDAAAVFFEIVNRQMEDTAYRFYAINHGNDLQGVFLTEEQFKVAQAFHKDGKDRPFVPTREAPWFGMPHDN